MKIIVTLIPFIFIFVFSFCGLVSASETNFSERESASASDALEMDGTILKYQDSELGTISKDYKIEDDQYRFSQVIHYNPFQFLVAGELFLAKNLDLFWWEGFVSLQLTEFGSISENADPAYVSSSNPKAEVNRPREDKAKELLVILGTGPSYRTKFPEAFNLFHLTNLFQNIGVYATYVALRESLVAKLYQGYGLRTDYGIQKRVTQSVEIGFRFSYQLAIVKRSPEEQDRKTDDRRLYLAWPSLAFNYTYFF